MAWGNRKDGRPARVWTSDEKAELLKLRREQGADWVVISARFPGSTVTSCKGMYWLLTNPPRDRSTTPNDKIVLRAGSEAIADRDRRSALLDARTDITANFFGDPPPGYSALDGREGPRVIDRRSLQMPSKPTLYWGRLKPPPVQDRRSLRGKESA